MQYQSPNWIIQELNNAGFEAYFVGGCVRDLLLRRPCHDWDVTTSARPEETLVVFPEASPTGIEHGTVTIPYHDMLVEVTTFRSEGEYSDGRHPDQVQFVTDLYEDLVRRDFTINAMAMNQDSVITDLFCGRQDLQKKIIRCIGDPVKRFQEDALRMMRAVRFSAQLEFDVEENTLSAIKECAMFCEALSIERIRDELEKVLLSSHPEYIYFMSEVGILSKLEPNLSGNMRWIANLPKDRVVRWAAVCMHWKDLDLSRLRIDRKTAILAKEASSLCRPADRIGWKRLIAELVGCRALVEEIFQSGECLSLSDLEIRGSDFPEVKGKNLGLLLRQILQDVIEHPEMNKKEKILEKYKNSIDY